MNKTSIEVAICMKFVVLLSLNEIVLQIFLFVVILNESSTTELVPHSGRFL